VSRTREIILDILKELGSFSLTLLVGYLIGLAAISLLIGCSKEGEKEPETVQGETGQPGSDGKDGSSCTVKDTDDGAIVLCEDGSSAVIVNGQNGEDAEAPQLDIDPIIPCPTVLGSYPEVLLCIANELFAVYDGGPNKDRLVSVPPGSYVTSDGRNCNFSVVQGCEIQ
jgi:hypothetical protein